MNPTHDEVMAWTIRLDERIDLAIRFLESKIAQPDNFGFVEILNVLKDGKAGNLANRAGLERHKPEIRYLLDECGGSFDTEQEAIDSCDRLEDDPLPVVTTFVICAYCGGLNAEIMENADEWVYDPSVYFPCPTYTDIYNEIRSVM